MKRLYLISMVVLTVAAVVFVLFANFFAPSQTLKQDDKNQKNTQGIIILTPKESETISSPLRVAGFVNGGGWIGFEGQVGIIKLFDEKENILAEAILTAKGEWMKVKINFEATLWFDYPEEGTGKLIFYNENPSGEPEKNKTFVLPIKLTKSSSEKTTFKVYFNNSQMDPENSCSKVFPVDRQVQKTASVARAALEKLLKGPSYSEKKAGYFTSINTGVKVQSLTIENNTAKVDFDDRLEKQIGGSCRVSAIKAQIEETLKQFSTVKNVVISINGRTEDILQP